MMFGMTVKVTISLPDDVAEAARARVAAGEAESLSGYIAAALEEKHSIDRKIAALREAFGTPTAEEMEWAERKFQETFGPIAHE